MSRRLRIAHVLIQPVLVWDDGEELEPGPEAQAVQVKLSELAGMADQLRAELASATTQNNPNHPMPGYYTPDQGVPMPSHTAPDCGDKMGTTLE